MNAFASLLFFALFGLAVAWLFLVHGLFRSLERQHPDMYREIGSPRGFEPRASSALLAFLLTRKPEALGDPAILRRANAMRVLLAVYVAGFGTLVCAIVLGGRAA